MTHKDIQALTHFTPNEAKPYVKLTNNQWSVYFYLLSVSDYNAVDKEDHRYVYRKNISASAIARTYHFSTRTYYNILETLENYSLINNRNKDYILLPLPKLYTTIPRKLLQQLLDYHEIIGIELLRTYLFFRGVEKRFYNKPFTIRNILRCLGISDTRTENYHKISACIDLLSLWKLISYSTKMINDEKIGKYRTYLINWTKTESKELDERAIESGEILTLEGLTETELNILRKEILIPVEKE